MAAMRSASGLSIVWLSDLDERSGYVGGASLADSVACFPKLSLDVSDQSHPSDRFRWIIYQGPICEPGVTIVPQQVPNWSLWRVRQKRGAEVVVPIAFASLRTRPRRVS
jgi:hypothetical protein